VTALLLSSMPASSQTALVKVRSTATASVTPKTDRKRPYRFTVKGTVLPVTRPLKCGPGVTNPRYCTPATARDVCRGKVRVIIKRGSRRVTRKTVSLRSNCRYTVRFTIRRRQKPGRLTLSTRFLGNTYMVAKSARTLRVRV